MTIWETDYTSYVPLRYTDENGQMQTSDTYRLSVGKIQLINKTDRVMNQHLINTGYKEYVKVHGTSRRVHRLIWEHVNGPIPKDRIITHIDGNKLNNNIANLQCITQQEICLKKKPVVSEKRAVQATDTVTNETEVFESIYAASKYYDIAYNSITQCCLKLRGYTCCTSKKFKHTIRFDYTDKEPTIIMKKGIAIPNNEDELNRYNLVRDAMKRKKIREYQRDRNHRMAEMKQNPPVEIVAQ